MTDNYFNNGTHLSENYYHGFSRERIPGDPPGGYDNNHFQINTNNERDPPESKNNPYSGDNLFWTLYTHYQIGGGEEFS